MQEILFIISLLLIILVLYIAYSKKQPLIQLKFQIERQILQQHVLFYQALSAVEKSRFEEALHIFLQKVRITGVKINVEDMDRVFIAAAAIIPIFAFKGWEYRNIHEVLLYPRSFNNDFKIAGNGRDTLGMVGNGPMQNVMILSQQDLRNDFLNNSGKSNTAIHEFVHLIDKTDGATDGLPEVLLPHKYAIPWLQRIHQEIQQISVGGSDINPYATTNEAEFFAVVAEYFFKQPYRMEKQHPALFEMLKQIFITTQVKLPN